MNHNQILSELAKLSKMSTSELAMPDVRPHTIHVVDLFLSELEKGSLRSASCLDGGAWAANSAVKEGILFCFRVGQLADVGDATWSFIDKDTLPTQRFDVERRIRMVPGGSSVRRGAYVGPLEIGRAHV